MNSILTIRFGRPNDETCTILRGVGITLRQDAFGYYSEVAGGLPRTDVDGTSLLHETVQKHAIQYVIQAPTVPNTDVGRFPADGDIMVISTGTTLIVSAPTYNAAYLAFSNKLRNINAVLHKATLQLDHLASAIRAAGLRH